MWCKARIKCKKKNSGRKESAQNWKNDIQCQKTVSILGKTSLWKSTLHEIQNRKEKKKRKMTGSQEFNKLCIKPFRHPIYDMQICELDQARAWQLLQAESMFCCLVNCSLYFVWVPCFSDCQLSTNNSFLWPYQRHFLSIGDQKIVFFSPGKHSHSLL